MSEHEIQGLTDQDLAQQWNIVSSIFDGKAVFCPTREAGKTGGLAGILQLSRETDRRGLSLDKNLFGDIILVNKNSQQNDSKSSFNQGPVVGSNGKHQNRVQGIRDYKHSPGNRKKR